MKEKPDAVLVVGDVNSTVAAALVASKLVIPLIHVEAGLRSFDRTMPEEVNRVVTDHLSDVLFVTEASGVENLRNEGITGDRVQLVGNCMIDTLKRLSPKVMERRTCRDYDYSRGDYGVVTLHRPSNVDDSFVLERLWTQLEVLSRILPLIVCAHPRLSRGRSKVNSRILVVDPLPYIDFVSLVSDAALVVTDSGGLQEEDFCS